jgi:AcrR family transcriptional regulator
MSNLSKSQRTRREILDIAWNLIAERGAEVSVADIAAAAGMTRQSVYVHFGSRGGLLMALVRRADEREGIIEALNTAMTIERPDDRFDACLKAWFAFVPKIHPVARDLIRLRATDAEAAAAWHDRMDELHGLFTLLVKSLKKDKVLASGWTVSRAADYLWAGVSVQAWSLLVEDRGWSAADAAKTIRQTMTRVLLV